MSGEKITIRVESAELSLEFDNGTTLAEVVIKLAEALGVRYFTPMVEGKEVDADDPRLKTPIGKVFPEQAEATVGIKPRTVAG